MLTEQCPSHLACLCLAKRLTHYHSAKHKPVWSPPAHASTHMCICMQMSTVKCNCKASSLLHIARTPVGDFNFKSSYQHLKVFICVRSLWTIQSHTPSDESYCRNHRGAEVRLRQTFRLKTQHSQQLYTLKSTWHTKGLAPSSQLFSPQRATNCLYSCCSCCSPGGYSHRS